MLFQIRSINGAMRAECTLLPWLSATLVSKMTIAWTLCRIPSSTFRAFELSSITSDIFLRMYFFQTNNSSHNWFMWLFDVWCGVAGWRQQCIIAIVIGGNGRFVETRLWVFVKFVIEIDVVFKVIAIDAVEMATDVAVQPIWNEKNEMILVIRWTRKKPTTKNNWIEIEL